MSKQEGQMQINLTLEQIYSILCPDCQEKLLTLAAQSGTIDSLRKQLKEQWQKK